MTSPVRIPADVERPDRVLAGLTGRQLGILTAVAVVLYGLWAATRAVVPVGVFLGLAAPVAVTAAVLVLGSKDGVSLDRIVLAAVRQRLTPSRQVAAGTDGIPAAPDWLLDHVTDPTDNPSRRRHTSASRVGMGPGSGNGRGVPAAIRLPAQAVGEAGVVDLGRDGVAVIAVASTVNFSLRTPVEQEALVATFARYLHSLSASVQILIRTDPLDLSPQIADLHRRAPSLPHAALDAACREHADYLTELGREADLLRRQVFLILREPLTVPNLLTGPAGILQAVGFATRRDRSGLEVVEARRTAQLRLVRRLNEAIDLLSPAGIVLAPLDSAQTTAVLAAACNPDSLIPATADLAASDDVITLAPPEDADDDPPTRPPADAITTGWVPDDAGRTDDTRWREAA